jgi:hypothetical protein
VRPVRAIVYGVGAMGSIMARLMLEKDVEIVGAVARSPQKVGRDLGDVAGLDTLVGVTVESDARRALEAGADIAVVAAASYVGVMFEHFKLCLEHRCNVVTIEEETVWPWATTPDLAEELDAVGKRHGATLAASGAQDVFWLNLVTTLLGASHRIEAVSGRCTWNADDYGPEVARHVHLGETPEEFDRFVEEHGWPDFVVRSNLEALVASAGLTTGSVSASVRPVVAPSDIWSHGLGRIIASGRLLGVVDSATIETREGPVFAFEMAGCVYPEGSLDTNEWTVQGEPDLHLFNDRVPTRLITCTSVINRIPDVIAASPGLVTLDRLPRPRYRHGPMRIDG